MSNIAVPLKSEIIKLARKELSDRVRGMEKVSEDNRREIVVLKRTIAKLQQQMERDRETVSEKSTRHSESEQRVRTRFTPKGLSSERKRLGLSADDYGKLVGVSGQSIYNWEAAVVHPRKKHVRRIATVRGIAKREAQARLAKLH